MFSRPFGPVALLLNYAQHAYTPRFALTLGASSYQNPRRRGLPGEPPNNSGRDPQFEARVASNLFLRDAETQR